MQNKYIGLNPLFLVVMLLVTIMVIGQYREAKHEEALSKHQLQTVCLNGKSC